MRVAAFSSMGGARTQIHLYDAPFVGLVESKQALAGDQLVAVDSPVGKLGVTICYDMHFPELYQKLTYRHGAQVLGAPRLYACVWMLA